MKLPGSPVLPAAIEDEAQLDELLTRPGTPLVEFIRRVRSPLLVLGAGGKMGPTLAVLASRAAAARHPLRVIGVSRFQSTAARAWLEAQGVETISCDLFDREAVARLPEAADVIYMVGVKFGTAENPSLTWAANTIIPTNVAERFPRARLVALSTGNVYPLVPITSGGATEAQALTPLGEYGNAAVARERLFEFHSRRQGTPVVLIRLNYAAELRYGVLRDIAQRVRDAKPVDVTTGHFNCVWQGDANDCILRSLGLATSPPLALNLTGPDVLSVRSVAARLGELLGRPVTFAGQESDTALLNNPAKACGLLGPPQTRLEHMLAWVARWVERGGVSLNKPTHFEVRDGKY